MDLTEDISEQSAVTEAVEGLLDLTGTGTGLASQSSNVEVMEVESDVDKTRKTIKGANLEDRTKCVLLDKILQPKPPKITHVDMILWEDQMVDVSATFSSIRTPSAQIQIPPAFSPSMFQTPPTASIPGFFQVDSATATGGQDIVSSAATLAGLIPPTTPSTMVTLSHLSHFQQQQQPMFQQPVCQFHPHFLHPQQPITTSTIVSTQLPPSQTTSTESSTSKPKPKVPKVKRKDRTQSVSVPMEL